ncbi:hypothetical protein ALC60_01038 [Trachymyrmex zeteki]|uniref:Uncharacterized protein n=1 Tax=Mycetomoellerius zeteki TaxID=64791 RepID=A0A151XI01_9HYME|nr:hypothetical protein ALC60_01038 [Trachymyrmex zeteki]
MSWLSRSWTGERAQGEFPGGERDSRHDQKRRSALMPGAGRGRIPGSEGPLGIRDASFVGIVGGVVIESTRSPSSLAPRINLKSSFISQILLKFSKVHYTEPEPRPAGAENLTLFAKLPESADAAFKDGIPARPDAARRSGGEAFEWFSNEREREERKIMPGY